MTIMSALKMAALTEISKIKEKLSCPHSPSLLTVIENARRDWQQAVKEMDHIDGDMAEYVIFKINASERRYMALLEQARREGIASWPSLAEVFQTNEFCTENGTGEIEIENESVCTG